MHPTCLSVDQPHTLPMMTHAANNYSRAPPPVLSQQVAVTPGHPVSIIQTLAQPLPHPIPIVVKPDHTGPMPLHHQIIMTAAPPGGTIELAPPQLPPGGVVGKHESVGESASQQLQQFVKKEMQQPPQPVSLSHHY